MESGAMYTATAILVFVTYMADSSAFYGVLGVVCLEPKHSILSNDPNITGGTSRGDYLRFGYSSRGKTKTQRGNIPVTILYITNNLNSVS